MEIEDGQYRSTGEGMDGGAAESTDSPNAGGADSITGHSHGAFPFYYRAIGTTAGEDPGAGVTQSEWEALSRAFVVMKMPFDGKTGLPLEHGFRDSEFIGYKVWHVIHRPFGHLRLRSPSQGTIWKPREAVHEPRVTQHGRAGIYAFKTAVFAGSYCCDWSYFQDMELVIGTVRLWGRVIECQDGYRAEFAAVDSIIEARAKDLRRRENYVKRLREEYAV